MKPGRNDPCFCGSGKKYKKCCDGRVEAHAETATRNNPVRGDMPTSVEIDLLIALFNAGRYAQLESSSRLLIEQYPDSGFAWKALGISLQAQGKDAVPASRKATEFLPDDAEAHNNLGNALLTLGQVEGAVASYRRTLAIKPDLAEAHYNLGNSLRALGQDDNAVASYRRALEIKPDYLQAHNNLGNALRDLEQVDNAVASYRRALEIQPDYVQAHNNLGNALRDLGQGDNAVASYRRALEIKPDYADAHTNLLFSLSENTADAVTLFAEHCRYAEQFEAPHRANWSRHANSLDPERPLRIGFVSGDLRDHAVAYFIEPALVYLSSRPELTLHAYYNHNIDDSTTRRLREYFAQWSPISYLSDAALAEKIRADNIDILIDLSGHTAGNRLLTFARKPAPVQASWMGYPGTTGLQGMDYYLTDRVFLPQAQFASQFTEEFVYLPAYASFLPAKDAPAVNALPALSNGHVTFGSFNRRSKINPSVIALWSQLLRALPDSRMLLAAMPEGGKYDTLIDRFAQEGIARERLSFHANCGMDAYLELHHQVDICLDTFPYNGGTMTLHALWMGVPTLTLVGSTAAGRAGASILDHAGLETFVANDAAEFVRKGMSWGGNLAALSDIRTGLRVRFAQSAMGQPELVAEAMQRALRIMWQRWCAGLPAASFEVTPQDSGYKYRPLEGAM